MRNFRLKNFILFTLIFILCVPIGTLHHECGHYLAGKAIGQNSRINYMSTMYIGNNKHLKTFFELSDKNIIAIEKGQEFADKQKMEAAKENYYREIFLFTLGGPLITILTGTLAFVYLLFLVRKKPVFSIKHYVLVFISLFWLRAPANMVMGILGYIKNGYISTRGDEVKMSYHLNLPPSFFDIFLGIIGIAIGSFIVFKIIPYQQRLNFILAGFCGGILGYYLWLYKLGELILP